MTVLVLLAAVVLALLIDPAPASASNSVGIYTYSQEASNGTAQAGASVTVTSGTPGHAGTSAGGEGGTPLGGSSVPGESSPSSSESSQATPGRESPCVSAGQSMVSPCYGVTRETPPAPPRAPTGRGARPPVNPAAIAETVASRLALTAGGIVASPSARMAGLTGAASWFWLSPPPAGRSLSVSLAGESVTVSAAPSTVQWSFGDGAQLAGGPGVPYRPGAVPSAAILHAYKTRCLPGDQGHDPYVLSSCGANGYQVAASVVWSIFYQASGPVSSSGALPSRATSTSTVYPVSEARAFLTSGGGR